MVNETSDDRFRDPLSMDISRDLRRIDAVTTQILNDRRVWDDFIRDPNGVLIRLGLHPPTTPEISNKANRAFYAILTNEKLLRVLHQHYQTFKPDRETEYRESFDTGLREGVIQYDINFDLEGAYHLLDAPEVFREVLCLALHDFNEKDILANKYSADELNRYVEQVIAAVRYRQPIYNHPELETYDSNYGIGPSFFCTTLAECAAVVTVGVGAEGAAYVTAIVEVGFWGYTATPSTVPNSPSEPTDTASTMSVPVNVDPGITVDAPVIGPNIGGFALLGDEEMIRKLQTLGRLAGLTGDMLAYLHHFEQKKKSGE